MAKFDAKAKARRQKIIAAVLGVLLLGVLVYEVPSVLKMMHKKPPASAAAPVTPPPAGSPLGNVLAGGTPVAAVSESASLVDSDPPSRPAAGQLVSFDRFSTKDPFVQPGSRAPVVKSCEGSSCSTGTTSGGAAPKSAQPKPVKTPAPAPGQPPPPAPTGSSAKISVNGESETVAVSASFPESDPVFVLASVTRTTAKIGIAGGSLDSGNQTVTLTKGKKLTLMNTADGTRYELVLLSVS
jgi:hypothetical protein